MAQLSSLKSIISDKDQEGERIGELAGYGSVFGIIAATLGLLLGKTLIPIPSLQWVVTSQEALDFRWVMEGSTSYPIAVAAFMGLMALNALFKARGSKELGSYLGSAFVNVYWVGFLTAIVTAFYLPTQFAGVYDDVLIPDYLTIAFFMGTFFVIAWQLSAYIYADSSKTWIGFLSGLFNALFIPLLAFGQALSPLLIYAAYIVLLVGQLFSLLFWWSPFNTIREFARSPDKAKFGFGVAGVITFTLGLVAVLVGPIGSQSGVAIFYPWSTLVDEATYQTNPALVFGFIAFMLYWIMLAPRLGARELKAAAIGEDIIKGANKYVMIFLALFGLLAAGQAGGFYDGVGAWGYILVVGPAGVMFLMGASYTAKTDIVTGLPFILTAVFLMVHPYSLLPLVLYPWILIIITQIFVIVESWIRGLTGFSQGALTVVVSLTASIVIIIFMIGGFGSGPLALWPTNRWFNITLIPGIPAAVQGASIIALPLLALLVRNVSLAGYSYGRGYATGGILMGVSVFFAFMIPAIAGNFSVAHEANTGAALLLALYAISVVLVLSLNLNLSNDLEDKGHGFEAALIKVATIAAIAAAAIVVVLVFIVFAAPTTPPEQIALMISIMVTFVVSSEILSIIGWLLAGIRLGMLRQGFRFVRLE